MCQISGIRACEAEWLQHLAELVVEARARRVAAALPDRADQSKDEGGVVDLATEDRWSNYRLHMGSG